MSKHIDVKIDSTEPLSNWEKIYTVMMTCDIYVYIRYYVYLYVCTNQIYTKPVMNMCCHVSLITCVPKAWAMAQEKPSGVWELSYVSKKATSYLYRWKVRFKKPKEGRNYSNFCEFGVFWVWDMGNVLQSFLISWTVCGDVTLPVR